MTTLGRLWRNRDPQRAKELILAAWAILEKEPLPYSEDFMPTLWELSRYDLKAAELGAYRSRNYDEAGRLGARFVLLKALLDPAGTATHLQDRQRKPEFVTSVVYDLAQVDPEKAMRFSEAVDIKRRDNLFRICAESRAAGDIPGAMAIIDRIQDAFEKNYAFEKLIELQSKVDPLRAAALLPRLTGVGSQFTSRVNLAIALKDKSPDEAKRLATEAVELALNAEEKAGIYDWDIVSLAPFNVPGYEKLLDRLVSTRTEKSSKRIYLVRAWSEIDIKKAESYFDSSKSILEQGIVGWTCSGTVPCQYYFDFLGVLAQTEPQRAGILAKNARKEIMFWDRACLEGVYSRVDAKHKEIFLTAFDDPEEFLIRGGLTPAQRQAWIRRATNELQNPPGPSWGSGVAYRLALSLLPDIELTNTFLAQCDPQELPSLYIGAVSEAVPRYPAAALELAREACRQASKGAHPDEDNFLLAKRIVEAMGDTWGKDSIPDLGFAPPP